jgi:putative ABC transport system permease protein
MENLLQDIRYAIRVLFNKPGFTIVAVLTLALGIGANTAIFSIVNTVLLRPLPYKDSDRLVMIWESNPKLQLGTDYIAASAGEFIDWRDQNRSFESIAAMNGVTLNLTGTGEPERISGVRVSANLFHLMGVEPKLGRSFLPEEDSPGSGRVAIIGHGLWKRRFGSDPSLVGRSLTFDGESYTVVGIMPSGFQFPNSTGLPAFWGLPSQVDLWIPLALTPEQINSRGDHPYTVIGRLKPDVTLQQAQAEMSTIYRGPVQKNSGSNNDQDVVLLRLQEQVVGKMRPALLVLLIAVGFVLLISCANVANLLLARSFARQKELAVRVALGATRARLILQLLTESLLLSLLGGVAGILLEYWAISALLNLSPGNIPRLDEVSTDARVLCFTLSLTIVTGLLFGLAPAFQASSLSITDSLKDGVKGSTGGIGRSRLGNLLVVSEVALSIVLLIGAGLLIRSFARLLDVEPGFNPENVVTMNLSLPETKYPDKVRQTAFFQQLLQRIESLPGVKAAAMVSNLPFSGADEFGAFVIEGRPPVSLSELPIADRRKISEDYFRAMEISLLKGRVFTDRDDQNAPKVVVVSESFVRKFFPNEDPIGKQIKQGDPRMNLPLITIVGVVGDVKHMALESESRPTIYMPYSQRPTPAMTLLIRTASDPKGLVAAVRNEIWAVDRDEPVTDVKTLEEYISDSTSLRRFNMVLLGIFAALALILSGVGIYGVISYSVTQRTHEIGIRMALGADAGDVLRLIVGQGMKLALIGIAIGLPTAFALTTVMSNLLYGVSAADPVAYTFTSLLLTGVAFAACYIPARRATKVDPMIALRCE